MDAAIKRLSWRALSGQLIVAALLLAAIGTAFCYAPTERTMGQAQRIVYVHVPVAWLGLLGMITTAGAGAAYLARRNLAWDHWAQAASEVGWLSCTLTLATGSLWAREAWGVWWEWDPRLTSAFVLWLIYSGLLLVRSGLDDPHRKARVGAILAILGALDIPLVVMATRWFRGMHPVSPEMEPAMRITLLIGAVAWTAFFVWLTCRRRAQIGLEKLAADLQRVCDSWT